MLKGRYQLINGFQNNPVTVGFGSYGQVKLGRDKETGIMVAIKIINKLAKNQVVFHNRLTHPKIIELLSYQVDREKQITYMVLQYADGGTLFEKIKSTNMKKQEIRKYFQDVCVAVDYLHSKDIMHRDIKPQNILLTKKKDAKLCDFGFAAILGERTTLCGTYEYMSPQMIQGRPYDYKIDIWALGILLFEMIAGRAPFQGESPEEVLNQMKTKIFFCQKFDQQEIDLIKMILRVTPSKRPNIMEILSHSYFSEENLSTNGSSEESVKGKASNGQNFTNISMKKKNPVQPFSNQMVKNNGGPISLKTQTNSYPFYKPKDNFKDSNNIPQFNGTISNNLNNNSLTNIKTGYYPSQKFIGMNQIQSSQLNNNNQANGGGNISVNIPVNNNQWQTSPPIGLFQSKNPTNKANNWSATQSFGGKYAYYPEKQLNQSVYPPNNQRLS